MACIQEIMQCYKTSFGQKYCKNGENEPIFHKGKQNYKKVSTFKKQNEYDKAALVN